MKRFFNYLLMATISLTAICTTSCTQINPLTPDEQLTEKIIGKWKTTTFTMDYYKDGKLVNSITKDYPEASVDVFNTDGTWGTYSSETCDDPSDPANADKLSLYIRGTFSIKDSVLTTTYSADNTYGEEIAGIESQYNIVSLTDSTFQHVADIDDDGMIIRMYTNLKKMK